VSSLEGCTLQFDAPFFNEIVVNVHQTAKTVLAKLRDRGILGGIDLGRYYPEYADCILMAATELTSSADIETLCSALEEVVNVPARV
jgi:glycine dehydrogenase subunit 1